MQSQYEGYFYTPLLWHGSLLGGLKYFELDNNVLKTFNGIIPERLRLGKRVEYFALSNLSQQSQIELIANNVQIQREKITLGELDCILKMNGQLTHLEIVYKFYLYVPDYGKGLGAWIGPNKKDSLIEKLNRLKNHQLPLLHQPECINYLKTKQIEINVIVQRVLFKAQLFLPEALDDVDYEGLNEACIAGRYIHYIFFNKFRDCKFFIPDKYDWLVIPHSNVDWVIYEKAIFNIKEFIDREFSPLVWIKHPNGVIQKYFIIWWS
ncbi:DUF1853 family protein [Paucihalobacter sp.]|uniref:DUF1853 family protein n=1 Tax=Paucihalobacter sp. TaxID=2850405 RepID=UPI002FE02FC6